MIQKKQVDNPAIAAILFGDGEGVDHEFETIINNLQSKGYLVGGYLQREIAETDSCCSTMELENIATGSKIRISQALGRGAKGCRLDTNGLAEASGMLLGELNGKMDLLILNRFGKAESEGQSFRAIIQKAMELNIPVLTAVRTAYLDSWETFGSEYAQTLSQSNGEALDWCLRSIDVNQHQVA